MSYFSSLFSKAEPSSPEDIKESSSDDLKFKNKISCTYIDGDTLESVYEVTSKCVKNAFTEVVRIKTSPNNAYLVEICFVAKSLDDDGIINLCDAAVLKTLFKNINGNLMKVNEDKTTFYDTHFMFKTRHFNCNDGFISLWLQPESNNVTVKTWTKIYKC